MFKYVCRNEDDLDKVLARLIFPYVWSVMRCTPLDDQFRRGAH